MAAAKYHTLTPDLTAGELSIEFYPRQRDSWRGTAAQLTEAGLIPEGFQWPTRTEYKGFTHDGIQCGIRRKPLPGGTRGRPWVGVDNWLLTRYYAGRAHGAADLYEKEQALRHALWRRSAEGGRFWSLYRKAGEDAGFQSFKRQALGLVD